MTQQIAQPTPRAKAIGHLREWIDAGLLPRGQALPSERALAARLEVGRATVRRALRALQAEGLVLDRGGHIRTVAPTPQPGQSLLRQSIAVLHNVESHYNDSEAMPAILAAAARAGVPLLAVNPRSLGPAQLDQLMLDRPMGLIVPWPDDAAMPILLAARRASIPVAVGGECDNLPDCDRVQTDDQAATFELTQWLLARGRRRILPFFCSDARLRGYRRALEQAQLQPLDPIQLPPLGIADPQHQLEASTRLAAGYLAPHLAGPDPIDAILASSDAQVPALAGACRLLGKSADDVLLAGYGNFGVDPATRPAATIDPGCAQLGQALVALLLDRVNNRLPAAPQQRLLAGRLIIHRSPPADAPAPSSVSADQPSEPLFPWKMQSGRWTLGGNKMTNSR